MKVLVTGATGFVGRALIALLQAKKKDEVFALLRPSSNRSLVPKGVEILEGDIFSQNSLKRIMEQVEVVIHLACDMSFYPKDASKMFKTNVEGTRNLARAAEAAGVRRFIFISTTEVISPSPSDKPADEDTPCNASFDYGSSKIMAEEEVKEALESSLTDYVILRPTGILGPGDFSTINQLFWAVNFGLFFFVPQESEGKVCFTHLADVVKGIELSIRSEEAKNQTIILSSNPMTYNEVIRYSAKLLGRNEPIVTLPTSMVKLALKPIRPIFNAWFPKRFLFEDKTLDQMGVNRWFSNEKAKKLLGWEPSYTFEEAIKDTVSVQLTIGDLKKRTYSMFFIIVLVLVVLISIIIVM